jgi:hypothetical protein
MKAVDKEQTVKKLRESIRELNPPKASQPELKGLFRDWPDPKNNTNQSPVWIVSRQSFEKDFRTSVSMEPLLEIDQADNDNRPVFLCERGHLDWADESSHRDEKRRRCGPFGRNLQNKCRTNAEGTPDPV